MEALGGHCEREGGREQGSKDGSHGTARQEVCGVRRVGGRLGGGNEEWSQVAPREEGVTGDVEGVGGGVRRVACRVRHLSGSGWVPDVLTISLPFFLYPPPASLHRSSLFLANVDRIRPKLRPGPRFLWNWCPLTPK